MRQVDLVFLVDSSASVGGAYFKDEIKFVKKLLADFTVDLNTTRVSIITFSSREKVVRHVDHLTNPNDQNHKCSLLMEEIPRIKYIGGGTYTLGAFLEAKVKRCLRTVHSLEYSRNLSHNLYSRPIYGMMSAVYVVLERKC